MVTSGQRCARHFIFFGRGIKQELKYDGLFARPACRPGARFRGSASGAERSQPTRFPSTLLNPSRLYFITALVGKGSASPEQDQDANHGAFFSTF